MRIKATLDRFENNHAVLTCDYGIITVPRQALPKKYTEGTVGILSFKFSEKTEEEARHNKTAKELLNELLNHEEKD